MSDLSSAAKEGRVLAEMWEASYNDLSKQYNNYIETTKIGFQNIETKVKEERGQWQEVIDQLNVELRKANRQIRSPGIGYFIGVGYDPFDSDVNFSIGLGIVGKFNK